MNYYFITYVARELFFLRSTFINCCVTVYENTSRGADVISFGVIPL